MEEGVCQPLDATNNPHGQLQENEVLVLYLQGMHYANNLDGKEIHASPEH